MPQSVKIANKPLQTKQLAESDWPLHRPAADEQINGIKCETGRFTASAAPLPTSARSSVARFRHSACHFGNTEGGGGSVTVAAGPGRNTCHGGLAGTLLL